MGFRQANDMHSLVSSDKPMMRKKTLGASAVLRCLEFASEQAPRAYHLASHLQ